MAGGGGAAVLIVVAVVLVVLFWPRPPRAPAPAGPLVAAATAPTDQPAPPTPHPSAPPADKPSPPPVDTPSPPVDKPAPTPPPPSPPVDKPAAEVRQAVTDNVRLRGSVAFDTRTESSFNSQTTYHQWKPDLQLENGTPFPLELGSDMLLIESNADGSAYEGVAILYDSKPSPVMTSASLGLNDNYETRNARGEVETVFIGPNTITTMFGGVTADDNFGTVKPGASWDVKRVFEEQSWLRDELRSSLLLVFPEVRVRTAAGVERYRLTASFRKPASADDARWELLGQDWTVVRPEPLRQTLASPTTNQVAKVLAANWLADAYPDQAAGPLAEAAKPLQEGQVLATCLDLLTALAGKGLEAHALDIFRNEKTPNGIRNRAARYLGAVRYEPALDALVAGVNDQDNVVAVAAIDALGTFGGPRAVQTLLPLFRDDSGSDRRSLLARSLAHTKAPEAVKALEDAATGGNADALDALAEAGLPETFDFLVRLARSATDKVQSDQAVRGLRKAGGDKAVPVLLELLDKDAPPADESYLQTDAVVDELAALNSPGITPQLVEAAGKGNLRAVQALAGSKNDSVRAPLTSLAGKATGTVLLIVLDGLERNWAAASFDVFAAHVGDPDAKVVHAVVAGLRAGKSPRAAALLIPLLKNADETVRSDASAALMVLPCEDAAPQIVDALLAATEDGVVLNLTDALLNAKWKDLKAAPKIGGKLASAGEGTRFALIRLLRSLSGDAMGPKDYDEFSGDADGWTRKWVEWAAKQ